MIWSLKKSVSILLLPIKLIEIHFQLSTVSTLLLFTPWAFRHVDEPNKGRVFK